MPQTITPTDADALSRHVRAILASFPEVKTVVTQIVAGWEPGPAPEHVDLHLERFGLDLRWLGGAPGLDLDESPTYFVLAGRE